MRPFRTFASMGATEIVFIFVIYLLLFGAKGVPSLARTMGKAVRQFREASSDIQREIMNTGNDIRNEINRETNSIKDSASTSTGKPSDGKPAEGELSDSKDTQDNDKSKE